MRKVNKERVKLRASGIIVDELTPEHFADKFPNSSRSAKREVEGVAQAIMRYMADNGNEWRPVDCSQMLKEGYIRESDRHYFGEARKYCVSARTAVDYSESWDLLGTVRNGEEMANVEERHEPVDSYCGGGIRYSVTKNGGRHYLTRHNRRVPSESPPEPISQGVVFALQTAFRAGEVKKAYDVRMVLGMPS